MAGDLERLAYEAALRALDKQEGLLEELRARTGILLAASSLAASFLGRDAFQDPGSTTVSILALAGFVVSVAASVYILMPKRALLFSQSGPALYEGLYSIRDDAPEIHRRLAYELYRFWESNDTGCAICFTHTDLRRGHSSLKYSCWSPSSAIPLYDHDGRP